MMNFLASLAVQVNGFDDFLRWLIALLKWLK